MVIMYIMPSFQLVGVQYTKESSPLYLAATGILLGIVSLLFIPWSWDCLLFQTKTFQPREGSKAFVCGVAPATPPEAEKSRFETKDNP